MFGVDDALIAGGASLLGGLASTGGSMFSASQANKQSAANAQQANIHNWMSTLQSQAWQDHMASTAYQRSVKDMKAAGLNPALMYGSGGSPASVPGAVRSEAQKADVHVPRIADPVSPAVSSALQYAQVAQALEKTRVEVDNVRASTREADARTTAVLAEIPAKVANAGLVRAQERAAEMSAAHQSEEAARAHQDWRNIEKYGSPHGLLVSKGQLVDSADAILKKHTGKSMGEWADTGAEKVKDWVSPGSAKFSNRVVSPAMFHSGGMGLRNR